MLSKRQRQLLRTLDEGPRSGSELARALGVSRRTVIREVASVSAWLESMGAGSIASDPNYHLVVTSDEALASLLSQDLSDEARVLLCVLRTPGVAIAQVAEETYLSPRAVRAAMAEANDRLQGIASLEARVGYGIDARFTGMEAPDLLAALAMDNSGVLAELERSCGVDSLMRMVGEKSDEYRLLMEPYLSQGQLRIQTLAAAYCCAWIVPDSTGVADARVRAVSLFQGRKQRLLYRLITHRAAILARINEALSSHGIRPTREDLGSLIFDHVLRCALFPTLMSAEIQGQMRSMRMEHPFEFDFGSDLSESFREFDEHLYVEPDFLSLYVLASLEHYSQRPVRVLLVCSRPSVATINKTLIERGVDGVEIELADDEAQAKRLLEQGTHDLVVGDSIVASRFSAGHDWDLSFSGVLSAAEVDRIRQLALRVLYECDIENLLPKGSYLELHVGGTDYLSELSCGLKVLEERGALSAEETGLILDRENQGERLQLDGVAFPHSITPVMSATFRLLVIRPDVPLRDGGESIGLIVITLASQRLADKSSMFNYLFSVMHDAERSHARLPRSYGEVVSFLRRDFGYASQAKEGE
ncbi:HTH domain-containing protein [Paratractidigestivibacter faecalis]|uniref:HTH domain-containing protein n=1 Tax=Paratractidigestivibacter faecalis TaxID=2292441 RepID=UPI000E3E6F4B|nr:HTH domain-containing protein [Paratractidigestivibacter faecalis]